MRGLVAIVVMSTLVTGCAGNPQRPSWGAKATLAPGWKAVGRAAKHAATDPVTWMPLVTAAALSVGDADEDLSEWAADHRLFGDDASRWSDDLRDASYAAYVVTALAAPGGEGTRDWFSHKASGLAVGFATFLADGTVVDAMKETTERDRPDDSNDRSFPSGHASQSAVATRLAAKNLDYNELTPATRLATDVGLYGLAIGTAWARVEAEKHFVTDVLVGYSVGRFLASFMNEAFLEGGVAGVEVSAEALPGGGAITVSYVP